MTIQFFVPGEPCGKARPRVTRKGTYTPKKTVDAERLIGWEAKRVFGTRPLLAGPLRLSFSAKFSYPKSWSKKRRASTYWHVGKPDIDNILKLLKDALNKVVWVDDAQIAAIGHSFKHYVTKEPGLVVMIEEL